VIKRETADMDYEQIQVECCSGYKINERPVAFTYQGRLWEIQEIIDRWYEGDLDASRPVIDYFKVRTTDGKVFLLRYLSAFDVWSIRV
jgi:hypothetical protein